MNVIKRLDPNLPLNVAFAAIHRAEPDFGTAAAAVVKLENTLGDLGLLRSRLPLHSAVAGLPTVPDILGSREFTQAMQEHIKAAQQEPTYLDDDVEFNDDEIAAAAELVALADRLGKVSFLTAPLVMALRQHATQEAHDPTITWYRARSEEVGADRIKVLVPTALAGSAGRLDDEFFDDDERMLPSSVEDEVTCEEIEALLPGAWEEIVRLTGVIYGDIPEAVPYSDLHWV